MQAFVVDGQADSWLVQKPGTPMISVDLWGRSIRDSGLGRLSGSRFSSWRTIRC